MGRPKGSKNKPKVGTISAIERSDFPAILRSSSTEIGHQGSSVGIHIEEATVSEPNRGGTLPAGAPEETVPRRDAGRSSRGKRTRGQIILDELGEEFVRLRESAGRSPAWASLQSKLMLNLGTIVPEAASFKECISISLDIEDRRKSEQAHTKAPGDVLKDWLQEEDEVA